MSIARPATLLLATMLAFSNCSPQLPLAPRGPHRDAPLTVPYPPPPARVSFVPPRPSQQALWLDGYWRFEEGAYRWRKGRWVKPETKRYFSPPKLVRKTDGTLYYYPGRYGPPPSRKSGNPPAATAD